MVELARPENLLLFKLPTYFDLNFDKMKYIGVLRDTARAQKPTS